MREIKFRAWDTVNEIWLKITGFETHISDDDKTASINTGLAGMFHDGDYIGTFQKHGEEQNNVILVEYTGLKDVNGVEIYEGDIVDVANKSYKSRGQIAWSTHTAKWLIAFYNGATFELGTWCTELYEVIGNIYENPELLSK